MDGVWVSGCVTGVIFSILAWALIYLAVDAAQERRSQQWDTKEECNTSNG